MNNTITGKSYDLETFEDIHLTCVWIIDDCGDKSKTFMKEMRDVFDIAKKAGIDPVFMNMERGKLYLGIPTDDLEGYEANCKQAGYPTANELFRIWKSRKYIKRTNSKHRKTRNVRRGRR